MTSVDRLPTLLGVLSERVGNAPSAPERVAFGLLAVSVCGMASLYDLVEARHRLGQIEGEMRARRVVEWVQAAATLAGHIVTSRHDRAAAKPEPSLN